MRRRVGLLLVGLVVALGACGTTRPDDDAAFYQPPEPLPAAAPGTIIRSERIDAVPGAKAWRILYHSTARDGRDIAVSGVIVVPTKPASGPRPVVTWAHGSKGLADVCAPSRDADMVSELPGIDAYVAAGTVVVATDYEGLGTPGVHPFLVGESEAHGVLDAARAAQQFPDANASNRVAIYGYSQGGHAALFAGQLAPTYAPDLDVVGVVAGAPIAELRTLLPLASGVPALVGYPVMGVFGYEAAYPEVDPASVLTPAAVEQGRQAVENKCEVEVLKIVDKPVSETIAANPESTPPWPALLEANSAGRVRTPAPILLVQGGKDTLVFPVFTDELVQRLCAVGDTVALEPFPEAGHVDGEPASAAAVAAWTAERFAGKPAPNSCP